MQDHTRAPAAAATHAQAAEMRFGEFVSLIAVMIALSALAIDIMLPAMPDLARAFALQNPNDRQLVVTAYMLGFAVGQPFYGPLSDRFGRKPVLVAGLLVFLAATLWAVLAPTYEGLLAARALQGFGGASPRIMAVAIVRDRFAGRDMARVMSFVMMVFIVVPILAPALGEGILLLGPWEWTFATLLLSAAGALAWSVLRLPETRSHADRMPLSLGSLGGAVTTVVTTRLTLGYTVAMGFLFGGLLSYIGSAQQIFVDIYDLGRMFPVMFGAIACAMALASFTNARLVGRLGMRRVSHLALLGYLGAGLAMGLLGFPEHPPLWVTSIFLAVVFFCFGLIAPNFNAMAMEPLGRIAGMASSFIGFYTTAVSAVLGWLVGQAFDGTVRPLTVGFAVMGALALVTVLLTERRLAIGRGADPARSRT